MEGVSEEGEKRAGRQGRTKEVMEEKKGWRKEGEKRGEKEGRRKERRQESRKRSRGGQKESKK